MIFSDSVLIQLPFDDKYFDLNSKEENFGVGIIVFQDTAWIKLKTKIDIESKTITGRTKHFSTYVVYYPWSYASYFEENKHLNEVKLNVPFYGQGDSQWCAYYSLSMIARYSGYNYKAPYFAGQSRDLDHHRPE